MTASSFSSPPPAPILTTSQPPFQPINHRHLLLTSLTIAVSSSFALVDSSIPVANGRGLLKMPPSRLSNR
ncbi:hypothetical protein CCACVL1_04855 [Corchorus capsularis]|uniref:Uncharacterized protein n=1 Tax=Corchorus capsularis TaxID=210143 RepID=A0A1R3JP22_COCAP|nr:hypothetical protein CCACVL1_04855 [Corchorus capsularis]